jgi:hypothetical protein
VGHTEWHGLATAAEPIVAGVFLGRQGEVTWCKSERARGPGTASHLALARDDKTERDVQVSFSVGKGWEQTRTLLSSAGYRPEIKRGSWVTGRAQLFTRVDGEPLVDCDILFLATQQVRVGRSGLWRVREHIAELLEPPLRSILTRGIGVVEQVPRRRPVSAMLVGGLPSVSC